MFITFCETGEIQHNQRAQPRSGLNTIFTTKGTKDGMKAHDVFLLVLGRIKKWIDEILG